ncbi:MAG: helix-turn-helix domain-containing protein [Bacilli bacterium]|nr:helix-turn-helix domain-containing protein [Bacilli bacterium]
MDLANKLLELRKKKGLSQEEVADALSVSRQTISKWETGASTPDFDKIQPLCELYEISTNELLNVSYEVKRDKKDNLAIKRKKTVLLIISIFLYINSVVPFFFTELGLNEIIALSLFFFIIGVATCLIVYRAAVYGEEKEKTIIKKVNNDTHAKKVYKAIEGVLGAVTLILFLGISFLTGAWYITWIIWLIYALCLAIVRLVFVLFDKEVGDDDEEN